MFTTKMFKLSIALEFRVVIKIAKTFKQAEKFKKATCFLIIYNIIILIS